MQPQSNQLNFNFIFEDAPRQKNEKQVHLTTEQATQYGKMFDRLAGKATTIPYAKMVDFMRNSCLKNQSLTEILLIGLKSPLQAIGLKQFQTIMKLVACRQAGNKISQALLSDDKVKRSLAKVTEDAVFAIQKEEMAEYENQCLFVKNGRQVQSMTKASQDTMNQILQLTGLYKRQDASWTTQQITVVLHLIKKSQIFLIPKILPSCLAKLLKNQSNDQPNYQSMLVLGQHGDNARQSLKNTKKQQIIRTSSDVNKTPKNLTASDKELFFQPSGMKPVSPMPEPSKAPLANFDQFMSIATDTQQTSQKSVNTGTNQSVIPSIISPNSVIEVAEKPQIEGQASETPTSNPPTAIVPMPVINLNPPEALDIFSTNMQFSQVVQPVIQVPAPQSAQIASQTLQPIVNPPVLPPPIVFQPALPPPLLLQPQIVQPIVNPQLHNQLQFPANFSAFDSISTSQDNLPKLDNIAPLQVQSPPIPVYQPKQLFRLQQLERQKQSLQLDYIRCKAQSDQIISDLRQENQKLALMVIQTINMNRQLLRQKSQSSMLFRQLNQGYQITISNLLEAQKQYNGQSAMMQHQRDKAIQDIRNSQQAINNMFRGKLETMKKHNYDATREVIDLARIIEDQKLAIGMEFASSPPKQPEVQKAWQGFEEGVKKEERKPSEDWVVEKKDEETTMRPNLDWFVKENL